MIQFNCPKCKQLLRAKPEHAGKTLQCPCGVKLRVPTPKPAAAPAAAASPGAQPASQMNCPSCSQLLRVAATPGQTVRCTCGHTFAWAAAASAPAPQAAADPFGSSGGGGDDIWGDLPSSQPAAAPQMQPSNFAGSGGGYQAPASGGYQAPSPAYQSAPAASNSPANQHLAAAQAELAQRQSDPDYHHDSGGGGINGAVVTGGLMMVGAAVWFIVGLAGGIIFFYPPVLFVLGIISVFKGLLGED